MLFSVNISNIQSQVALNMNKMKQDDMDEASVSACLSATFSARRQYLVNDRPSIADIRLHYPKLFTYIHVSKSFLLFNYKKLSAVKIDPVNKVPLLIPGCIIPSCSPIFM